MRTIFLLTVFVSSLTFSFGQISVDNATYNTTQLVDGILIPTGSNTVISNVQFSGVYNNGGDYQVGYFGTAGNTLTEMGFTEGVVLSSGNTSDIPLTLGTHPGSVAQMATAYTSCTAGEVRKTGTCGQFINDLDVLAESFNYYNAAILEFDFIPVDNFVQFRYIFGSEEYEDNSGFINYQCSSYNDKFGFLISGPGIAGGQGYDNNAKNIATLGNGSEVGINSVNNGTVGSSGGAPSATNCQNANPAWLQGASTAEYLGHIDGTELNGNTVILTASQSGLTPGQTYHIKIIVTDVTDATYDAVVYLEAGSFTTEAPCTPPAAPTASVTAQPDCTTPSGTIVVTAPTGTDIGYSVNGTNYQANGTFTGLTPGSYDVTAQDTITGCTSSITQLTVNAVPNAPAAPTATVTIQPDCTTPTGTIVITAPTGTDIGYSIDGTNYQANGTFTGLTPGSYDVTAQDTITGCTSSITQLTVNAVPNAPAAPTATVTIQPDCTTPTGTIVVTAPTGTDIGYSIDGTNYQANGTFTGLTPGSYDVTAQDTITGCTSTFTQLTVNAVPNAPAAPTTSVTIQPDCTNPTGTIVVTAPTGTDIGYSIDGTNYQANGTFTGLMPGSYDVTAQDTITGCTSTITQLTVNAVPNAPAAPTASVTIQPDCATPTGTIVVTAPTGTDVGYSIDGTNYQANGTFTGLAPGSYDVTAQDTITGCTSTITQLTVNAVPNAPAAPTATVTIQPDCTTPTGTIVVTATGTDIGYSIDGTNYQANGTFSGLTPGSYNITAQDTITGCTSSITQLTVNTVPNAPATPTATVTVQPDCTTPTGTIVVTAPTGTDIGYSIDGTNYQANGTFTGLAPGNYDVTAQDTIAGCTSTSLQLTVNTIPNAPNAPTLVATVQPDCDLSSGTFIITGPIGANILYSFDGNNYDTTTIYDNSSPGSYDVVAMDTSTGCISLSSTVTINEGLTAEECAPEIECGELFVPTAFSPNQDGNNESFKVMVNAECVQSMTLRVFDKWGNLLFEADNPETHWDGTYKGAPVNSGAYVYTLLIKLSNEESEQNLSGHINLFH